MSTRLIPLKTSVGSRIESALIGHDAAIPGLWFEVSLSQNSNVHDDFRESTG